MAQSSRTEQRSISGKYRARSMPATVLAEFASYIRTCGLPLSDRHLLAAMVCELAPRFNRLFDPNRFLLECELATIKPTHKEK